MNKFFFWCLIALCFNSCFFQSKPQVVTIGNLFSMTLPSYMTKTDSLNDVASLEYQNTIRELYTIVIVETKKEYQQSLQEHELNEKYPNDLIGFSDLLLKYGFKSQIDISEESNLIDTIINQKHARYISITGRKEDTDLFLYLGFIEGDAHYYQVIIWTLGRQEKKT